jgi:hypothetical protein
MILYLFRGQYLIRYIFLFLLTLFLWGDALIFPEEILLNDSFGDLYFLADWAKSHPRSLIIVFIFILYLQALILNVIAEENRLVERNQLLVAAIYILMMSSAQPLAQPNILILTNFFLILQFNTLLRLYGKDEPYGALFDAGLLVGISSLLFYPSIVFLLLIFYALLAFQFFRWREWLIPIIGFSIAYFFAATWFFWFNNLTIKTEEWIQRFNPELPFFETITMAEWLIPTLFLLMFAMGTRKILQRANESTVDIRKKYRVIFFMVFVSLLMQFLPDLGIKLQGAVLLIPLAVILAAYTSTIKRTFYAELIFYLIILVIFSVKVINLL